MGRVSGGGSGTWLAVALAAGAGLPVVVFLPAGVSAPVWPGGSWAPALPARNDWHGRVLTGGALFCQRTLCQQVRQAGGDYLLLVKENQGALHNAIALLCDPPVTVPAAPLSVRRVAHTRETGHGRAMERRELVASTDLNNYLIAPAK